MLSQTEDLLILQDRDSRLQSLRQALERLPAEESRAKTRLDSDLKAVEKAKSDIQQCEIEAKKVELDVETRRTTIERLRKQQFETRKNDEYQALGHEIERYLEQVDELETQQLETMESADALRQKQADANADLATTTKLVEEDLAAITQRQKNTQSELEEVETERQQLSEKVDPELLHLYNRLLATKNGVAVAPLKAGQCGGCHVKLIPATLIKVQAGSEVAQCENCARILYSTGD